MRVTDINFFKRDCVVLAKALLGKIICRKTSDGQVIKARITETESYGGQLDSASHARFGLTKRNSRMFCSGGCVYVYLCYGIHEILNIVSGEEGDAQGVMIRGVEGALGAGRVSKKLCITRDLNNEDVLCSDKIWIEDDGFVVYESDFKSLPRVGISYALPEDREKLWRFSIV